MRSRLKKLARKYIPVFLHPYIYRVYAYVNSLHLARINQQSIIEEFRNSTELRRLNKLPTVQIIQPTFYDLDGIHYFSGGAERYLNDLSQIIIDTGYTPFIVQLGNKFWHRQHNNINVFGVPSGHNYELLNIFAHNINFGKPKLRIYSPFTLAFPQVDKNAVGISHGIFWDHPYAISLFPVIHKSFSNVKIFVSVDTSTISWLRGSIPHSLFGKDVIYLPNYVDLKSFYPVPSENNGKIRIIYPRRLYEARGYFLVDAIAANILNKYPQVELHFIGSADESASNAVKRLINQFKDRVFLYQESDKNMNHVYRKADIVLIPTVASEGTSLSCLEAMATGNAIIATNVGGLSDLIIDGYNGLLINPDHKELQKAIEKLVNNHELRKQLGQNACMVAKCFDKTIWSARWEGILTKLLS